MRSEASQAARSKRRRTEKFKDQQYFRKLYRLHRLTKDEYEELVRKQKGVCAICEQPPRTRLCVDHNHITGEVRGLLCHRCNSAIGHAQDDVTILRKMIRYLEGR